MDFEVNLLGSCLFEKPNVSTVLNAHVPFMLTLNLAHHIVDKLRRTKNKHLGRTTIVFSLRRDQCFLTR